MKIKNTGVRAYDGILQFYNGKLTFPALGSKDCFRYSDSVLLGMVPNWDISWLGWPLKRRPGSASGMRSPFPVWAENLASSCFLLSSSSISVWEVPKGSGVRWRDPEAAEGGRDEDIGASGLTPTAAWPARAWPRGWRLPLRPLVGIFGGRLTASEASTSWGRLDLSTDCSLEAGFL